MRFFPGVCANVSCLVFQPVESLVTERALVRPREFRGAFGDLCPGQRKRSFRTEYCRGYVDLELVLPQLGLLRHGGRAQGLGVCQGMLLFRLHLLLGARAVLPRRRFDGRRIQQTCKVRSCPDLLHVIGAEHDGHGEPRRLRKAVCLVDMVV